MFDYEVSHLASSIAFANEPVGDPVGQPMAPVFVNAPSGTQVTLALGNDTTGAVLTDPGGSLTATAVNGQATFKGLEVNLPGTYDLVAVAAGQVIQSQPFTETSPASFTWSGLGGNPLWSNGQNWLGGIAPAKGQVLTLAFPAGVPQNSNSDDIPNLAVGSLIIVGPYILNGSVPLSLGGKILFTAAPNAGCVLNMPIQFLNSTTVTSGAGNTLNLAGQLSGSSTLTLNGPGVITVPFANEKLQGPITLNSGILQDFNNEGAGKREVDDQRRDDRGRRLLDYNAQRDQVEWNATLDGAVKSAIILGSSFTVAGNAV